MTKQCPFCGNKNPDVKILAKHKWFVFCNSPMCPARPSTSGYKTKEEAIARWNIRAWNRIELSLKEMAIKYQKALMRIANYLPSISIDEMRKDMAMNPTIVIFMKISRNALGISDKETYDSAMKKILEILDE